MVAFFVVVVFGWLIIGCSGDEAPTFGAEVLCEPGKQEACACPGGASGAQACRNDGKGWELCVCPDASVDVMDAPENHDADSESSDGGEADGGTTDVGGMDGDTADTPVVDGPGGDSPTTDSSSADSADDIEASGPCKSCTIAASLQEHSWGGQAAYGTMCPGGADETTTPPRCIIYLDLAASNLSLQAPDGSASQAFTGTVSVDMPNLPVEGDTYALWFDGKLTLAGDLPFDGVMTALSDDPFVLGCSTGSLGPVNLDDQVVRDHIITSGIYDPSVREWVLDNVVPSVRSEIVAAIFQSVNLGVCDGQ